MIDHDRLFKELLTVFLLEFIKLFFPEVYVDLDPDSIEFLDKEVFTDVTSGEKHEADLVVKARFRGQDWFFLFHIEPQSYQNEPFDRRMFQYFARLYEKHKLPVYPIAIFSYDTPQRPEPSSHRVEFPGFVVLEFNFRAIQLNRLNWRDFLRHKNPVAVALMSKMKMKPRERKQVKFECLRLLATLKLNPAKMRLIAGFVDTYLQLKHEEETWVREEVEKLDPKSKEAVMEIMTSWEKRGREIGLQEGLQRGLRQEAQAVALRLLKRRFKKLSRSIERRVTALPIAHLEELCEAILGFEVIADLHQWLAEHEENADSHPA